MKKVLNKLQFGFKIGRCPLYMRGFNPYIRFYLLRLKSFPQEGMMIQKENYKGFLIDRLFFRNGFCVYIKTFYIFGKRISIIIPNFIFKLLYKNQNEKK